MRPLLARNNYALSLFALLCGCITFTNLLASAQDAGVGTPGGQPVPPASATMKMIMNPDGTVRLEAVTADGIPDGVILPSFDTDGGAGLVPLWMVEAESARREEEERQKQRQYEEEQA